MKEERRETPFSRFVTEQLRAMLESRSVRFAALGTMLVIASVFSLARTPFGLDPAWMFVLPVAVAAVAGGLQEGMKVALVASCLGAIYAAAREGGAEPLVFLGWISVRLVMFGLIGGVLGAFAEAHHSVQKNWRSLASLDPLTQVANITSFYEQLAVVEATMSRYAVLVTDLDNLKALNDAHGHQAGSAAIQAVARILRTVVRGSDVVARFGGDEFIVMLRDSDRAGAQIVVNRINEELAEVELPQAPGWKLSVSVGVSLLSEDGDSIEELISVADAAMYDDKRARGAIRGVRPLAR
jgi:diguanylate cyclase (GGDEF)-like protein